MVAYLDLRAHDALSHPLELGQREVDHGPSRFSAPA